MIKGKRITSKRPLTTIAGGGENAPTLKRSGRAPTTDKDVKRHQPKTPSCLTTSDENYDPNKQRDDVLLYAGTDLIALGGEEGNPDQWYDNQPHQWLEEESNWYDNSEQYHAPEKLPPPRKKLELCACGRKQCTTMGYKRYELVGKGIGVVRVSRQSNREHIAKYIDVKTSKLLAVKFHIKLHHYPIEHRHSSRQRGDEQFRQHGKYVVPSLEYSDIREEIRLAAIIKSRDNAYYTKLIEPHLLGHGDGSLTLSKLRMHSAELGESNIIPIKAPTPRLQSLTSEEVIKLAKTNGSAFIKTMVESMQKNEDSEIPRDIPDDQYMAHYLRLEMPTKQEMPIRNNTVTARLPHSIASRRSYARPAKHDSGKDITMVLRFDVDSLMQTLIPMNEPPKATKKQDYVGSKLSKVGMVEKSFIAQNESMKNYQLMQCYDKDRDETIYVDINGELPSLTTKCNKNGDLIRTSWNHAQYYLIGEVLTRTEVTNALDFSKAYNRTYLAITLLFMCRMKGKDSEEMSKEDKLRKYMDEVSNDELLHDSVNSFEIFFERYVLAIVRNLPRLGVEDLTRFTWPDWNVWNEKRDHMYGENGRITRMRTRRVAGSTVTEDTVKNNLLNHYFTILLHTQGM